MFTVAYVFRRPEGMGVDEFHDHYRDVHGGIASRLPGLVSYVQYPVRQETPALWHVEGSAAAFDAISIYTFESDEAAAAAFASQENLVVQDDSVKFIDFGSIIALSVTPRPVV